MVYFIRRRASAIFELMVSAIFVLVLIGLFGVYMYKVALLAKETALQRELGNLRTSLELYRTSNGRNPGDLSELYEDKRYFVLVGKTDKYGRLLDQFGNAFHYDPGTGDIRTTTDKYKDW